VRPSEPAPTPPRWSGTGTSGKGFAKPRRRRVRLSSGGRYAKSLPEVVEVVFARLIGRDLGTWEGCAVQLLALVVFAAVVYWVFASGLFAAILTPIAEWYAHQLHFGPVPTPSPLPT